MKSLVNIAVVLMMSMASRAHGEPAAGLDSAAAAKLLAPYLDGQTLAVGRLDVTRVDVEALLGKWVELLPAARRDADDLRPSLLKLRATLVEAGVVDAYVVLSLADIPVDLPFVVVPKHAGATAQGLRAALDAAVPAVGAMEIEDHSAAIVVASPRTLERLRKLAPEERPGLAEALRAIGDPAAQLIVMPTDNDRRVIAELMPRLPAAVGSGSTEVLTNGVRWLALGVDLPPKIGLKLIAQSANPQAAAALGDLIAGAAQTLAQSSDESVLQPIGKALAELQPVVEGDQVVISLDDSEGRIDAIVVAVAAPMENLRARAHRLSSMNHLKQLALAIFNFADRNKRFPAVGSFDASGQPLLSWRVHVLPYLDEAELYKQFRLDEPWDSPHNSQLISKMPEAFACPGSVHRLKDGLATYREVVGEHTAFPGREGIEYKQIIDGTSNTIMLVEVDDEHAVTWTKPEGLPLNVDNPAVGLGGHFPGGFTAAYCDGSAHFIELPHDPRRLRLLLLRDDGEVIPPLETKQPR